MNKKHKNVILFVGSINSNVIEDVREWAKKEKRKIRIGFLTDEKRPLTGKKERLMDEIDLYLVCDTTSDISLQKVLVPLQDELLAIVCRADNHVPLFAKIVPHVPYLKAPTSTSLLWATDKVWMRRRLYIHNKKITPSYVLVSNTTQKSIKLIKEKVGFPLIVKPSNLGASRLVSIVYHEEELKKVLGRIFRSMKSVSKTTGYREDQKVLVEQYMDGDMYSIDAYVSGKGKVYFCPLVYVKTGRSIGFDDFFGYQQGTPTQLKKESVRAAENIAKEAIHALALRSTSVHIELMRTEKGWKVIELGPRLGGFRHTIYKLSFGINHNINDVLIRLPEKPIIPKKLHGHSIAMKFFAKREGRLTQLVGIRRSQELKSFQKIYIHKKVGDMCRFAKHGGSSVFDIILFNKDRSKLLADIRRLEQMIKIETK